MSDRPGLGGYSCHSSIITPNGFIRINYIVIMIEIFLKFTISGRKFDNFDQISLSGHKIEIKSVSCVKNRQKMNQVFRFISNQFAIQFLRTMRRGASAEGARIGLLMMSWSIRKNLFYFVEVINLAFELMISVDNDTLSWF